MKKEEIVPKNDIYVARVESKDIAELEVVATKESTKIKIIEITQTEEETIEDVLFTGVGKLNAEIPLNEDPQKYVIRIISAAENVAQDYDLILEKKSQNTNLSYVKIDGLEAIKTEDGSYIQTVSYKETHPIIIKTVDEKAKVKISYKDTELDFTQNKLTTEITLGKSETIEILITVQSENGEEAQYTLRITDNTRVKVAIKGKIITENVNGEHLSEVAVYKITEEEGNTKKELFKQIKTNIDGTFKITMYDETDKDQILEAKYELVVTKQSYLSYTIKDITIEVEKQYDIGEYNLIAGDITKTGEINLDDLVALNDNYGKGIEEETIKYDLNEDGKINTQDRNILKKNYDKKAETRKWEPDF